VPVEVTTTPLSGATLAASFAGVTLIAASASALASFLTWPTGFASGAFEEQPAKSRTPHRAAAVRRMSQNLPK
jgi:hypothetical protein